MVWIYTLASVVIVSLVSLVGTFTFAVSAEKMKKFLVYMVSFAAGSLLGDVFIHLIPEAFSEIENTIFVSLSILLGIIIFFVIEKFLHWRHCHEMACDDHPHPFSYVLLVGDMLHNFIDGMIIAASYLISIPIGIATTLAVIFHEIPQEIGDFGSLLYAGFKKTKALLFNFLTALTAVLGAVLVLVMDTGDGMLAKLLIPFAAGGFIYIASSDLIPELHKDTRPKKSIVQFLMLTLGIVIMFLLVFWE